MDMDRADRALGLKPPVFDVGHYLKSDLQRTAPIRQTNGARRGLDFLSQAPEIACIGH